MLSQNRVAVALLLPVGLLLGCSDAKLSHVSGKVTFDGRPVPAGKVYILPDAAQGKTGAAGFADIKDGVFDTKLPGGQAGPTGAVIFAIEGIDPTPPPNAPPDVVATVLFPRYEVPAELPPAASTKDLEVPLAAAQAPATRRGAPQ